MTQIVLIKGPIAETTFRALGLESLIGTTIEIDVDVLSRKRAEYIQHHKYRNLSPHSGEAFWRPLARLLKEREVQQVTEIPLVVPPPEIPPIVSEPKLLTLNKFIPIWMLGVWLLLLLILITLLSRPAHGQVKSITIQDASGNNVAVFRYTSPDMILRMGTGMSVVIAGRTVQISAAGGTGSPGLPNHSTQINQGGGFAGVGPGTAGQILCSNGALLDPQFCDPIVSGPDAIGIAHTKNPVFACFWDGTNLRCPIVMNSNPLGTEYGLVTRNIPSGTQTVSGSLGRSWTLLNTTDSVNVGNFPSDFNVNNFPATQAINFSQYLGVAPGTANPVHTQLVVGGVVIDPRSIRTLTSSDVVDVSDRAVRLVGVVYGSQAQQLKQTATNFNLQVELATGGTLYDARQIRALTSADVVDMSDRAARLVGVLSAGTNRIGSVRLVDSADADLTSVKGTQTSRAVGVQELKDAGRSRITFTADAVAVATTEGLVTFTKDVAGTATTGQTTYSVTAAKTFRVQSLSVSLTASSTTVARVRVRFRENTGGACIASSTLVWTGDFGPPTGTLAAGVGYNGAPYFVNFPDGLEFPAADSLCLSEIATTNTTAFLSITLVGYEY